MYVLFERGVYTRRDRHRRATAATTVLRPTGRQDPLVSKHSQWRHNAGDTIDNI